ncbi:sensor domain-containing phosphodiesterase [Xanthomonas graminis]|jgi:EAL domain-containing protein (putative c-di-GMP-specific phosphodiesterase class I)|uniref:EAL domain-containing protein n=1 Tax=Xanthomonas graminis pv. graminis TaxID=134874 RepID=A0A1M4J7H8_9XANT|nr:sensor domain-containing phosphodiesterase [Xanthomonas translucens]EKU24438.1 signaling protein [Xanthomonas translucens pv. graminis ART-Xtg29]UKE53062.1 sensor domain-containing phosphodiesterase [Xanthomonas translucens pv. graminis]WIH07380.1 sensor domain-containing phosphodiesterase [Xanthomonas translucens pv. graminis]WIH10810.1 sensor domain-containing phosphodiesterase [Xanthomonas translucens pv. graminis]WIH17467.1 sensor domain-containing phosphodiesterase [Xanthomonas translu
MSQSSPPPLPDESTRLATLRELCLLDTPPDRVFDLITQLASRTLRTPIALVSLIDEQRQWFKSRVGLDAPQTPRSQAFCAHAIHSTELLVVADARQDPRFRDNPLVTGPPFIRFYAGAPLMLADGTGLGTLCVIDSEPRSEFDAPSRHTLQQLRDLLLQRIETLRNTGFFDALTGLPNRSRFNEDLTMWLSLQSTDQHDTAVAIDVCGTEYFRNMAKALGWEYAEGYVLATRDRLLQALDGLPAYRIDTTSFAFIVQGNDPAQLTQRCERVCSAFAEVIDHQGIPHAATASLGAVRLDGALSANHTLRAMTTAVDMARQRGLPWSLYERSHDASQRNTFRILAALPEALDAREQLSLHYQPRVSLRNGECVGVEALLRWQHPLLGNVAPNDFIPLAEKTALMSRVTTWVLQAGIAQAALWQRQGHRFSVSLNVSAVDLERTDFIATLRELLAQHALEPGRIEIEFTESAMIRHPQRMAEQLQQISTMGVKIAIDDFGSGYSNLSYLKRIPANALKIDQSFIRSLPDSRKDCMIVPSMIRLGHDFGQQVVAEGIESEEIYGMLREWGCDEGQGYWIARPMPAAALDAWLATPWRAHA